MTSVEVRRERRGRNLKSSAQISFDSFQVRRPVSLCDASLFLNVQQLDIQTVSTHVGARHLQMEGLTHVAGKRGRRAQRTLNGFLSPAIAFSLKPHSFFPLLSARPSFMSARESLTELIGACAEIFWFQANWPLMSNYANLAPNFPGPGI